MPDLPILVPFLVVSQWDYEFPSIAAGCIGLAVSVLLAGKGVGLEGSPEDLETDSEPVGAGVRAHIDGEHLFQDWGRHPSGYA